VTRGYLTLGLLGIAACGGGSVPGKKQAPADSGTRHPDAARILVIDRSESADAGARSARIECAGDSADTCIVPEPASHIVERGECDLPRSTPELGTNPSPKSECYAHDDCADGSNGRCSGANSSIWRCSYDGCFADADCPSGSHCVCGLVTEVKLDGGFERARGNENRCVRGNCALDRDCGDAGYCSHSSGPVFCNPAGGRRHAWGDYCHTSQDVCIDDSDCRGRSICDFDPDSQRWECFPDCVE
jgi:hypothetical protein